MTRSIVLLAAVSAYGSGLPHAAPKELSGTAWSNIRAEYQRHRQAAFPVEGGYRARNYGQRWVTRFDGRGFDITPDAGLWRWGLELGSYGFLGQERPVKHARASADVERLVYQWDPLITEWFSNNDRGLEHGFTIADRPGKSVSALMLHLTVRGTLTPLVSPDGRRVTFLDDHEAPALNYLGLRVTDARGVELAARFVREAKGLRLEVEEQRAHYPITIDPLAQQAYLKPAAVGTSQAGDWFGYSVAVSGNTVVVGAPQEDSSSLGINSTPNELAAGSAGAAYVFTGSGGTWTQQAYLKPKAVGPGGQAGDHFGWSVAISGDTVVVGAIDEDSSTTGVNSTPLEGASDSGAAYVFVRSGGAWTQEAYLKPPVVGTTKAGTGYEFGWSVAISGDTIAVGAYDEASSSTGINSSPNELAPGAGAAYVFARSGGTWAQQAYLKPAAVGTTQANDHYGNAIAVSGDTVVVGAFAEDSGSTGINGTPNESSGGGAGAAYIYVRSGGAWSQQAYLKPAAVGSSQATDAFGTSVAVSGDTVVVGANHEASSTLGINTTPNEGAGSSGAVYVFTRSSGVWSQQAYVKPSAVGTTQAGDGFGTSVAISGDTMVVGAIGEDSSTLGINTTPNELSALSGAAYVFTRSAGVWSQQAYLKPAAVGTTQAGDAFGWSVAVSGDMAVVGAYLEDSSSLGVNSTPNEGAADSGSAYVFTVPSSAVVESKAVMISPVSGTTFTGSSVTFTWTPGTGAANYVLDVGTVLGGADLFHQNVGLATLQAITGLPTDGSTIYVRLSTALSAGLQFNDYTYKASVSTSAGSKAVMVSPVPGSTLTGSSVTFTWTPGSGATAYWLDVGTAQGQANIFGQNVALVTSQTVSGIPTDASTVYVNLWTLVNGAWQYNAYTYKASGGSAKAVMISPVPGSTLSGASVTFTWTSATGATAYWLDVATGQGQGYIFGQGVDLATSQTVSGIPTNGSTIYVRLWTLLAGSWQSSDYTYKAAGVNAKAVMLLPTPSSVLGGATVTFTWSAGSGATAYWLDIGGLQGQSNFFDQNVGLATSQTVSGLPTSGSTVYVRLWTTFGGAWQLNDYTYKAASVNSAAVMLSPLAGTALGSTVTFSWKPGVGALYYWFLVGSYEGRGDIFGDSVGLATSKTVSGLPNDGSPVYVFIRTMLADGFHDNEYIYKAPGGTRAVMTFPPPASQLNSTNVIFTWKPGNGATSYWLEVGTSNGASNLYSQVLGASTTSRTVTGVPTGGGTIYVRLWTAIQGQWQWNDYSYNAAP